MNFVELLTIILGQLWTSVYDINCKNFLRKDSRAQIQPLLSKHTLGVNDDGMVNFSAFET